MPARWLTNAWVLDPGAVTPIFMPLRSFGERKFAACFFATPSEIAGVAICSTKALSFCPRARITST